MGINVIYTLLLALFINLIDGTTAEPSIAHSVFLSREFDPFSDIYLETVTRMNASELMHLPKLSDTQFLNALNRGIDILPISKKPTRSNALFDPNYDEQLEYQSNIEKEWGNLMSGGPASINYMGAVMAIASKKDFPLKTDFNYTLVKYPNSFRSTLVQVSNEMYKALYGAHTAMNKIQLNMRQIPALLKTVLKLVTQASVSMTKTMLPRTLSNIGRYVNESAAVARASSEQFEYLQKLLIEIIEVTAETRSENEMEAAQIANETRILEQEKEIMDQAVADLKAAYETARKDLEKARADYHAAMLNVPGGQWDQSAWLVYQSHRPAVLCSGWWIFRKCRSQREQQFAAYTQEAKQKAQQALDLLKAAEQYSKDLYDKVTNRQDELGIAIQELALINFNAISVNETITVLVRASKQIGELNSQWGRITRYFTSLAAFTENTQNVAQENFIGAINDVQEAGIIMDPIDNNFFTEYLVNSATDIDRDSHLLYIMAKTYCDISNEFMMDQIASISGLLAIQNDAERDAYVKDVAIQSEVTTKKVKELAAERQRIYELANIERQEQYLEFIDQVNLQEEEDILNSIGIGKR